MYYPLKKTVRNSLKQKHEHRNPPAGKSSEATSDGPFRHSTPTEPTEATDASPTGPQLSIGHTEQEILGTWNKETHRIQHSGPKRGGAG